jgi:glycosyltransferase involved in cell wall biosynthesis
MPPVRVVIAAGIFPPDIGGPASYVPELAAGLVARGNEVTVVTLTDGADHDDRRYPFRVIRVRRGARRLTRRLRAVIEIARCGRDAHVLLTNGLSPQATIAGKIIRRPVVEKVVGDLAWEKSMREGWSSEGFEAFQSERLGLRAEALKTVRRWWVRQADCVITPSRYLASIVRGWGVPDARIAIIANAVQLPERRLASSPACAPRTVATVGRLVVWKHVDGIIRAVRDVPATNLLVIGDGPERQNLQRLVAELGMESRVTFTGQVSRSEVTRLTRQCDLFVLNSSYEGQPHVVLEAMASGLPVVATAAGGTVEVIRHAENGMLIRAGETELREAMTQVLNDRHLWRRLSENGRQTAAQFTTALMVEKTEQILASVARTARDPGGRRT